MVTRILLLLSVSVAITTAVECHYKGAHLSGTNSAELKSMYCEDGCCGTLDEQECCDAMNWWMIFAFILVGLFLIFVIMTAVYLIVKNKNKKKERVGDLRNNQAFGDQPNTVDLSIFRTENSETGHPPAYSLGSPRSEHTTIERRPNPTEHFVQDRYLRNAESTAPWRNTDFSYLDKCLERSKTAENVGWNSALHRTGNVTLPSKLEAEFEEPRPYEHPDFTAECTYLGNTTTDTPESPTLEHDDQSQFHFMRGYN